MGLSNQIPLKNVFMIGIEDGEANARTNSPTNSKGPMNTEPLLTTAERGYLARAVTVAAEARAHGNHPFGAIVVTADGVQLEAENSVLTDSDPTGHAETNLVRLAASVLTPRELATCTLFTSTEPCAMCAGAIYWSGISRVVFALSEAELIAMTAANPDAQTLDLACREVFARGNRRIDVSGPVTMPEAVAVHIGFW
jgi:tRNA(Arg) A34 adenosine deaminase TadA